VLIASAISEAQVAKPYGAATPEEAVAAVKKAGTANDMLTALPVISPNGLKQIANEGVTGMLMVLAFSDPDDAMPGSTKPSKTELDTRRKNYKQALSLATATLKPYGLDAAIGKPVLAEQTQKIIDTAIDKADNVVLVTSLYGALTKMAPLLGMKQNPKPDPLVDIGTVTGYKITGDRATAQNGAETLQFTRIDGRWFIEPPQSKGSGGAKPSTSSSPANAGAGAQESAPRPTASGKEPEVVVGGVRIAKVIVPDNEFSAKPFQTDNGTSIVLWVKMPVGQGLIDIDEDASLLQNFGDDKGTAMGGKFGSFPRVFKDGGGGIIEIESSGFAATSATSLVAEGTLVMTVATGTRKTPVNNVRLQNDAKFTFGKTPIVVADVETQDDSLTFTLKLPRQVMEGIKDVAFRDAKGQPLEGRSTGSGYMNDAAEMMFTVKTAARTVTIEFEAWQGQRTVKVPFKVKAGLAVN
jgi:methylmalonyl-CoA mutase cobalamin-binding subunit